MACLCMVSFTCRAQENDVAVASTQVNEYSYLSIEQLEYFIGEFEALLDKKSKPISSIKSKGKVYQFYEGDSHELNIYNLMKVMEEVGLSNQCVGAGSCRDGTLQKSRLPGVSQSVWAP